MAALMYLQLFTGCVAVFRGQPEIKDREIQISEAGAFASPYLLGLCQVKDIKVRLDIQLAMK